MGAPHDSFPGSRTPLTSRRHPLVERCRQIARGHARDRILLDGEHLVAMALDAGWSIDVLAAAWPAPPQSASAALAGRAASLGVTVHAVSTRVIEAMSPVQSASAIVAIASRREARLDDVLSGPDPLVVVACDVQDPGNVGAIVRAADACGATAVVCGGTSADPFGWKALRGSMGSALRLPIVTERSLDAVVGRLRASGMALVAAAGGAGAPPDAIDWRRPAAVFVGNEGGGLGAELMAAADARVAIPMRAGVESLNVAVATGILLYEASRQRGAR